MIEGFETEGNVLRNLAQQLLSAMSGPDVDSEVDAHLLKVAESLISAHQFYVHLSFVDLILDRMKKMDVYFETMDTFAEEISGEDMAGMSASEKVRGIQALTNATRVQLDTVNALLTNKDASNVLISNLRENFGSGGMTEPQGDDAKAVLDDIEEMNPGQRQRVLRGTIAAIRDLARREQESEE